jgi:hypothetical protein
MSEYDIKQSEADYLLGLEKYAEDDKVWIFPTMGMKIEIPLNSSDKKEKFILDVKRSTIKIEKVTYQNRAKKVIILARLDLSGPPHRNPDDTEVQDCHLHKYMEGYGDKWAFPIPEEIFSDTDDIWQTLQDFMDYCNIVNRPDIRRVMF